MNESLLSIKPIEDIWYSDARNFVNGYQGKPLVLTVTGGGIALANLMQIPGASRIIRSFYCPYSEKEIDDFINNSNLKESYSLLKKVFGYDPEKQYQTAKEQGIKSVSKEMAEQLVYASTRNTDDEKYMYVSVTAALTTNRYRKGENHAYIGLYSYNIMKYQEVIITHIQLPKHSEEEYNKLSQNDNFALITRRMEDIQVAQRVIGLLINSMGDQ